MVSAPLRPPVALVALRSIDRAIKGLWKADASVAFTSGTILGGNAEDWFPTGRSPRPGNPLFGTPPRMWPEVREVTEVLIGSAFAVAQAHLKTKSPRPSRADDIEGVANYWKHRDEWGPPWSTGTGNPHADTLAAITRLGAKPPVALGQLEQLALAVIGGPAFDPARLWDLIA